MIIDNKILRYCIAEPKCWIRIAVIIVLAAIISVQLWYGGAQAGRLGTVQEQIALVRRIKVMESMLKTRAQLEAFRNEGSGNITFSKISGIAKHGGSPAVLINGTVYDEGSTFGEYVIVKITNKQITLVNKKTNAIKNLYVFE